MIVFVSGPVSSIEHVWTFPEEQNCWFGTTTPTLHSSASLCSASLRTKTVRFVSSSEMFLMQDVTAMSERSSYKTDPFFGFRVKSITLLSVSCVNSFPFSSSFALLCTFFFIVLCYSLCFSSVTNLFLFTSSPVFCSVSLFIFFPFDLVFLAFDRVPQEEAKTNFESVFFCHNYRAKVQNTKNEF